MRTPSSSSHSRQATQQLRPLPPGRRAATAHAAELFAALRQDTLFRIVLCFRGLGFSQIHPILLRCDTDDLHSGTVVVLAVPSRGAVHGAYAERVALGWLPSACVLA